MTRIDSNQMTGYGLGGDGRQLGSISEPTEEDEQAAVRRVLREARDAAEAREVLEMLGLVEVATRMVGLGSSGAPAA